MSDSWYVCRFLIPILFCFASTVSAVGQDQVRYYGGSLPESYRQGTARKLDSNVYGRQKISGRLTLESNAFVFDGGDGRTLIIPYSLVTSVEYGPFLPIRPRPTCETGASSPASIAHGYKSLFLTIAFADSTGSVGNAVFELGANRVRPTLAALERHTGHAVSLPVIEACVAYKSREACGYANEQDLKGLRSVFVDTSGSREWTEGESQQRITAALMEAGLRLNIMPNGEDAEIVLRFHYNAGTRPQWLPGRYSIPDRASGEVYVRRADGLRLVQVYRETLSAWNTHLADRYARRFADAYKRANGIK